MRFKIKENNKVLLLTALMVYFSNGLFPLGHISAFIRVVTLITVLVLCLPQRQSNDRVLNKSMCVVAVLAIGLQIVTIMFYGIRVQFDIYLMLTIIVALLFSSTIPLSEFVKHYRKIIFWIAVISSIIYFAGLVAPSLVRRIPMFLLQETKWQNAYTFLGTFVVRFREQYTYYRSFGIFSEPGQYQIFLNIGLLFELFFVNQISKKNIIALLVALVTCQSTNGYLVMIALCMAYISSRFSRNEIKRKNDKIKFILLGVLGCIFIVVAFPEVLGKVFYEIIEKLEGLKSNYSYSDFGTGLERGRAFKVALEMYMSNPLTGLGYVGMDAYKKSLSSVDFIMTCTPLNWFARFGTIYGVMVASAYSAFFVKMVRNVSSMFFLLCAGLMMIAAQETTSDIFMWVLIMYGVQQLSKQRKLFYRRESDLKSETNT